MLIPVRLKKCIVPLVLCFIAIISVFIWLLVTYLPKSKTEDLIAYYEKLILGEFQRVITYQPAEDAKIYQPKNATVTDFGEFDFVIIGAGSTGSVIASRLSEVNNWSVLLLEAGNFTNDVNEVPALYPFGVFSDYNWGFRSVPQTTACLGTVEERCLAPRGRGVGGTTLINGLIYSRGHPTDYNNWAQHVGDLSWTYKNVLQYFKKSEDFQNNDPDAPVDWDYHSTGGYVNVEYHSPSIAYKSIFLEANKELGYNITDYNSPAQVGASVMQYNTKLGQRQDQASAFLTPAANRINLSVLSESYVTKIDIDNDTKEATGVIFTRKGNTYRVAVKREVIVSAGAISTPHILLLSGIGPKEHLDEVGIPLVENLPVGLTLRDHVAPYGIQFSSNLTPPNQTLREAIEDYIKGTGALTSNSLAHVVAWYKSSLNKEYDYPDIELVTDISGVSSPLGQKFLGWKDETWNTLWANNPNVSFYTNALLLHGRSVGTIKLQSSSPFDYPLVDFNFLSDPENRDIDTLYEGIQLCLKLADTEAFKEIGAQLVSPPLPACQDHEYMSKDYWYCFIRQTALAVYHPVGTCPTGKSPAEGAVVDSELNVFGVKKLRVADASVFPFTLSAHSHAPCTMIGEKISDVIKSKYLV